MQHLQSTKAKYNKTRYAYTCKYTLPNSLRGVATLSDSAKKKKNQGTNKKNCNFVLFNTFKSPFVRWKKVATS